jgi:hypothetical protein
VQQQHPRSPRSAGNLLLAGGSSVSAARSSSAAAAAAAAAAAVAGNSFGDSSVFLEPMSWMQEAIVGVVQGKLYCPNCQARLGSFNWSGELQQVIAAILLHHFSSGK